MKFSLSLIGLTLALLLSLITDGVNSQDGEGEDGGGEEGGEGGEDKDGYNGYYDIPARDLAYLCSKMDDYKKTGIQPDINDAPQDIKKEDYTKDGVCWKMTWSPCDPSDLKKAKPCGYYQMEQDSKDC